MAAKKGKSQKKDDTLLRDAIAAFGAEKGMSEEEVKEKICSAIVVAAKKEYGLKDGIYCEIDNEGGDYEIRLSHRRTVVENNFDEEIDEDVSIFLEDAQDIKPDAQVGDVIERALDFKKLGRVSAQTVKHTVRQGVREIEQAQVLELFRGHLKENLNATVKNIDPSTGDAMVEMLGVDALLPRKEQIAGERLIVDSQITIYVDDVKETTKGPKIMISRIHPGLIMKLFEKEVPEISDGTVEIKSVSREAGTRTKIAVYSKDENVDPIGACIGPKGSRVNAIVSQLNGEKIDIIKYSDNSAAYVGAALAPAHVISVTVLSEEEKSCRAIVDENQLSLAIGNKGLNARLAAKLTGWKIDIKSPQAEMPL